MQTSNNVSFAKIFIFSADHYKIGQHDYHKWLTVKKQLNKLFLKKKTETFLCSDFVTTYRFGTDTGIIYVNVFKL